MQSQTKELGFNAVEMGKGVGGVEGMGGCLKQKIRHSSFNVFF